MFLSVYRLAQFYSLENIANDNGKLSIKEVNKSNTLLLNSIEWAFAQNISYLLRMGPSTQGSEKIFDNKEERT